MAAAVKYTVSGLSDETSKGQPVSPSITVTGNHVSR